MKGEFIEVYQRDNDLLEVIWDGRFHIKMTKEELYFVKSLFDSKEKVNIQTANNILMGMRNNGR